MILEGWYRDRVFFHLIGYLLVTGSKKKNSLSEKSKKIRAILNLWNDSSTKEEFKEKLYSKIKDFLKLKDQKNPAKQEDRKDLRTYITDLSYGEHKIQVRNILLLFNIATLLSDEKSNSRFQFDRYEQENWDIEHISPQTDKIEITPTKFLEESLEFLKKHFEGHSEYKALLENIQKLFDNEEYDKCSMEILQFGSLNNEGKKDHIKENDENRNQIGNLTLLRSSNNSALGNKIFPEKRLQIIEWDRVNDFIPVCTKNVFLKYYTKLPETPFYWSKKDMDSYEEEIIGTLERFFGEKNR